MRNVAYSLLDNVFIAVWGRVNLSDAESTEVFEVFRRLDFGRVRMLVVTEGAGPGPVLRKQMNTALGGQELQTAVVTDDFVIRGVVTALSWFNRRIRWFPYTALDDALEYLNVPDFRVDAIVKEVGYLRAELQKQRPKGATVGR